MKKRITFYRAAVLLLVAALSLAACQALPVTGQETVVPTQPAAEDTQAPTMAAATESMPAAEAGGGTVELSVGESAELGSFLVDDAGMTLYLFTNDEPGVSNCAGDCLVKWPPLLVDSPEGVTAGEGVDASKIGTIPFEDGKFLVTYADIPLYYWVNDAAPGDTTGQGVGDVWFVVPPDTTGFESSQSSGGAGLELGVSETAELGSFLVDDEGRTLYLFTRDEPGVSNCAGDCLVNWPPLLVDSEDGVSAGEGVDDSKVGTIPFEDGKFLVTYDGWPLYYWKNDKEPGDTSGQGVGEVWYVVSPDGVSSMDGADNSNSADNTNSSDDYGNANDSGEADVELEISESADLGSFLVDGDGMTLYLFTRDTPGVSNCAGDCLVNWPPLLVDSPDAVEAKDGVDQAKVGAIPFEGGKFLVTYEDMPLYYWINDKAPGDTTGQNVGGVWFVVEP